MSNILLLVCAYWLTRKGILLACTIHLRAALIVSESTFLSTMVVIHFALYVLITSISFVEEIF